jgi:hypothetical protein
MRLRALCAVRRVLWSVVGVLWSVCCGQVCVCVCVWLAGSLAERRNVCVCGGGGVQQVVRTDMRHATAPWAVTTKHLISALCSRGANGIGALR